VRLPEQLAGTLARSHPDLDVRVIRSRHELEAIRARLTERAAVERLVSDGFADHQTWTLPGWCQPCGRAVELRGDWQSSAGGLVNFRERLICPDCGLNNRQRFMAELVRTVLGGRTDAETVYLYEQVTQFYAWAATTLGLEVVGSEYLGHDRSAGEIVDGVRHEDALALSFPDASLDLIVSNDVFEHVPDLDRALSESVRVLRPGGAMLFSIPFHEQADATVRRAELRDGRLVELLPGEYHGNPISDTGSLVFHDIGWDVLDRCERAGFRSAYLLGYHSWLFGYLGGGLQLVFVAER
jgi:SAM-dependent methyltransferase